MMLIISDIENKYITTADYNKFTKNIVDNSIRTKNLVDKAAIARFINNTIYIKKVATSATKAELKAEQNKIKKVQEFDLSYFRGRSRFEEDGAQNYLVFQPINRYFKSIIGVGNGEYIYFWKSKGLSDKSINCIATSNYSITPSLDYLGAKIRVKFNGSCLKQDKITYTHGKNSKHLHCL